MALAVQETLNFMVTEFKPVGKFKKQWRNLLHCFINGHSWGNDLSFILSNTKTDICQCLCCGKIKTEITKLI